MRGLVCALGIFGCATAHDGSPWGESPDMMPLPPDASGVTLSTSPDARPADAAVPTPDAPIPCTGGQTNVVDPDTGGCYMLFTASDIWPNVKGVCETMTPPAHLVTISDAAEAALVAGLASGREPWIGLTDLVVEGAYRWVNAEPVVFTNWNSGEPNDSGDCVRLQGGRWADLGCVNNRPYICER